MMPIGDEIPPADANLSAVFGRCRRRLGQAIGRLVKPQDVDDILQETFIRTYVASQKMEIRHPVSFMLKTARNLALNQAASAYSTRTQHTEDFPSLVYSVEGLESQVEAREAFLGFCRAVRELPGQCRRVFVLKKVYGLSQKEIADYLSISESTVEKHVARGLLMCMHSMRAMGYTVGGSDAEGTGAKPRRRKAKATHE